MNIGEISKKMNIPISTLRYYDKEGLLINVQRDKSGNRIFGSSDIESLKVIHCLKKYGMQIKDIKIFMDWCRLGDATIEKRLNMFKEREKAILNQINELNKSLELVRFKKLYYENILVGNSENNDENIHMPFGNASTK